MTKRVAIVGVGTTGFRPITPDVSYRELIFDAARKAYSDAGIEPSEIDGFVTAAEDFIEGYSIADEYCPDQIGAVLKPTHTVPGDFIQAMATGVMMIMTGAFKTVAIESHSKASNIKNVDEVTGFAMDPVYNRPLRESPQKPSPGPPVPPEAGPSIRAPRPTADMTRPRLSLGTISAISAEQAGVKKALATATIRRISNTWVKLAANTKKGMDASESRSDASIDFVLP